MKKLLTIILVLVSISCYSQPYVSFSPSLFTNAGNLKQRFSPTIEVGKQWDAFSLGFDVGRLNVTKQKSIDTTYYFEVRPNLNVFQQGLFTNTLTIGVGYIFNASENIMTELTTGIEYTPNKRWSYNIFVGTYYNSGPNSASNNNFFGLSIMYYLKPLK